MTRTFDVTIIKRVQIEEADELDAELVNKVIDKVVLNNSGSFVHASAREII